MRLSSTLSSHILYAGLYRRKTANSRADPFSKVLRIHLDGTITEYCWVSIKKGKRNAQVRIKAKNLLLSCKKAESKKLPGKRLYGKLLGCILLAYKYELQPSSADYTRSEGLKTR